MYTLTVIRLDANTKVFQNTEFHGICSLEKVESELVRNNASNAKIKKFLNFKGGTLTLEVKNTEKIWFYYIQH